jgi:hypothetical protein
LRVGLALLLSFFLSAGTASALDVRLSKDKLSIQAREEPLQGILRRLAAQGIRVRMDPSINPLVTASFEGRDIRRGLESVLRPLNFVLLWGEGEGDRGPALVLREIQIFEPGRKELMRPLGPGSPLAVRPNPADGSFLVKDEILLRLGPGKRMQDLQRFLEKIGGEVVESSTAGGVYRIRVPEGADLPAILDQAQGAGMERAEPNYAYPVPVPTRSPTASSRNTSPVPLQPAEGAAIVAVLDSGMKIASGMEGLIRASYNALNPEAPIDDSLGHGTQMALVASGAVKPYGGRTDTEVVPVIPIRIFDDNGFTSNFHVIKSIDFALMSGARVMSLSWGSESRSRFLEEAMNHAVSKGLIVVASAGNEATGKPFYPAAFPSVIGVGALAPDGKRWEDSNYGDSVMVYAPGFAGMPVGYRGEPGIYAGTSISAAYTAHLIAGALTRNPDISVSEILHLLAAAQSK